MQAFKMSYPVYNIIYKWPGFHCHNNPIQKFIYPLACLCCILCCGTLIACKNNANKKQTPPLGSDSSIAIAVPNVIDDTVYSSPEAFAGDTMIAAIKENFKRINQIQKFSRIDTFALEESTEGGELKKYYLQQQLQKMIEHHLGETYQSLTEYYYLQGKLSFVYEKNIRYNRPIYYDSATMKASGDTEVFDLSKATITETRSYFNDGKMLLQLKDGKAVQQNHTAETERLIKAAVRVEKMRG